MKKAIFLVTVAAVSFLLAGCGMKNDKKIIEQQTTGTTTMATGSISVDTGSSSDTFAYANIKIDRVYPFVLNSENASYVAEIPELKVRVVVPSTHYYMNDTGSLGYFNMAIASGLRVENNVIDGQLAFFDKDANANISNIIRSQFNVNTTIPECDMVVTQDGGWQYYLTGNKVEYYTVDARAFGNTDHAVKDKFRGGIGDVCGNYASNSTRIYYDLSHPDRYMQSMVSMQSVELLNGGTYIEYMD